MNVSPLYLIRVSLGAVGSLVTQAGLAACFWWGLRTVLLQALAGDDLTLSLLGAWVIAVLLFVNGAMAIYEEDQLCSFNSWTYP